MHKLVMRRVRIHAHTQVSLRGDFLTAREDWDAEGGIGLGTEEPDSLIGPAPASDAGAGGALTVRSTAEESPRTLKLLIIRQQVRAVTGGLHARSV